MKRLVCIVCERARGEHHKPLWRVIVNTLHEHRLLGATVTRGLMGFGPSGKLHENLTPDAMPDDPITIEVFDDEERIDAVLPEIRQLMKGGLLAVHDADVVFYTPDVPRST